MSTDFLTTDELIRSARRNLDDGAWAYLTGGSESETTMRRNRQAYDRWAFRPRVLVDVSKIDTSTTLLGQRMRIPVMLSAVGSLHLLNPEGASGSARAAHEFGTLQTVANGTKPDLEAPQEAAPGPKFFQFLVTGGDRDWVEAKLTRAKNAGYLAVAMTVDSAVPSRRERHMLTRWSGGRGDETGGTRARFRHLLTWDYVERFKSMTGLPFMLKGIQTGEDAAIAVQHGVDAVWVSNHGGRQLDHARATLDALPEIVEAVRGRAQIVVDGGIQRGSDVLKAITLGADAVAIGKLQGWALAAAGKDGVYRLLEILEEEMRVAMGLLGVTSLSQLSSRHLVRAEPVAPAHEMSSWVSLQESKLL